MSSIIEILKIDNIGIEILPDKKGLFFKHVEYNISSENLQSKVCRRFTDFAALHEVLVNRYPYRLVPKLPPATLNAFFNGTESKFIETRRLSLKRWLILLSSHPILSKDPSFHFFLTFSNQEEHTQQIREEFGYIPDEFVTDPRALESKVSQELVSAINVTKTQLVAIELLVNKIAFFLNKRIAQAYRDSEDAESLYQDLNVLCDVSFFPLGDKKLPRLKDAVPSLHKCLKSISDANKVHATKLENQLGELINILQDILASYKDLCQRKEKNLTSDNKKALDKISNIKKKKLKGILNSDTETASDDSTQEQEQILGDLERRQAFSVICIAQENEQIFSFIELLGKVFADFGLIESDKDAILSKLWLLIKDI